MTHKTHHFAYVLACGDPEIKIPLTKIFDARFGPKNYFWLPQLGGVKKISSPQKSSQTEGVFDDIEMAQKVHPFGLIIVINHSDCGAYRLAGMTFETAEAEETHHRAELNKSVAVVLERFPNMEVETHYFLKKEQKMAW